MMAKTLPKGCHLGAAMAAVAVFAPVLPVSADVTYDTRALTGDAAPGTGEGVMFSHFRDLVLNDAGQIAFKGTLSGKGVGTWKHTNDIGIWSDRSGSLKLIARSGGAAPGTGGAFRQFLGFSLNDAGQITISGTARVNRTNHRYKDVTGIWLERSGSLKLVARVGDAAPGTSRQFISLGLSLLLNDAGQLAFNGTIIDGRRRQIPGIWSEGSGSLRLVARKGDAAPGTEAVFRSFSSLFLLNGTDQLAFSGTIRGSDGRTITGIWSEESGSLKLVARGPRKGDAAPGMDGVFSISPVPVHNGAGQTAFSGRVRGRGEGIWSDRSGSLKLIVRSGDAAPGTTEGMVFSLTDPATSVLINDAGQIAFSNEIRVKDSPGHVRSTLGIWSERSGSLKLVALVGDAAPGTPEGVVFSGFRDLVLNAAGQIAFLGKLTIRGSPTYLADIAGIWATDSNGQLMLIARDGDLFDVNDDPLIDDLRTIREVKLYSFNDAGQLAFKLDFTGGAKSGIFVATISSSPKAVMTPIETTRQRTTHATESQTTQDDAPITQSQQPRAGSNQGDVDRPEITTPALPVRAEVTYDTRVMRGDAAPGTEREFSTFGRFVLNNAGQIAFRGEIKARDKLGRSVTSEGIWSDRSGSLKLVARAGDTAPGTAEGTVFVSLDHPAINDKGQLAFRGRTNVMREGSRVSRMGGWGIWSEGAGSLKLVARTGAAAPGTDKVFTSFYAPVINGAGKITFRGQTTNRAPGVWSDRSGSLKLVARAGYDHAAPATDKRVFISLTPMINGAGRIVFSGSTRSREDKLGHSKIIRGIWSDRSGSLKLIVRVRDPSSPGTDPGTVFESCGNPVLNDVGQIAFRGTLIRTNASVRTTGIWSDRSDSLKRVVRLNDAAPGTDGVFVSLGDPVINGEGQIAFSGEIEAKDKLGRSVTSAGIWSEVAGSLKLVALEGAAAPGTGEGVVFDRFFEFVLNGAGQVAFNGRLSGNGSGIWATDSIGHLMLIAREGDLFDVNDDPLIDDLRTIFELFDVEQTQQLQLSFNNAGQLAFYLPLSGNRNGIFVATIAEPATAVIPQIETKPSIKTNDTESKTTQDGIKDIADKAKEAAKKAKKIFDIFGSKGGSRPK